MLFLLTPLLLLLVSSTRTQLPLVHDLTWFTNSADALSNSASQSHQKPHGTSRHNDQTEDDNNDDLETNDKHTLTIMKEMTAACRQNPSCLKLDRFDKVACIRRCVSPMCYNQIYDSSPLEPGEIDVKYPQYKSCFHKLWKSRYRESLNIT